MIRDKLHRRKLKGIKVTKNQELGFQKEIIGKQNLEGSYRSAGLRALFTRYFRNPKLLKILPICY